MSRPVHPFTLDNPFLGKLSDPNFRPSRPSGNDPVNRPGHYQGGNGIEAISVIEGFGLNYRLGNVIKYILRADKKGSRLQDLRKAQFYLDREIRELGKEGTDG